MGQTETMISASAREGDSLYAGVESAVFPESVIFDADVVAKMYDDEYTAAMEAATFGVIMVTHQNWQDGSFYAHGEPIEQIIRVGKAAGVHFNEIEQERRKIEFDEEMDVRASHFAGSFDDSDKLVISPYPDEMSDSDARRLGYYPEKRIAMIRLHTVAQSGNKRILQIAVEKSDLTLFSKLLSSYGVDVKDNPTSLDILSSHLASDPQVGVDGSGLLDVVKRYDALLSEKYGKQYFLGREVIGKEYEIGYDGLEQRRKLVELESKDFITSLVDFRLEIARNLAAHTLDGPVYSRLIYSISNAQALKMSFGERQALQTSFEQRALSDLSVETLLKYERRRVWSLLLAKFDTQRAQNYFGQDQLDYFKNLMAYDFDEEAYSYIDTVLIDSQLVFYYCGGLLETREYSNGFECPNCGGFVKHGSGDTCPNCYITKQEVAILTGVSCD